MKFLSNFNVKPPCTNVKPLYWRLSGDGSAHISGCSDPAWN